ncbi:unnamed protein product [Rotaria sp. Silwood1]|nr:unnamed protein product [Rotaria sp. Silwood1]
MDKIDIALRFYTQLIQSKVKRDDTALHSSNDEQIIENNSETTMQPITPLVNSLCLTKDLLSSYYNLHRQYQRSILRDDISAQQEQVQVLFETEWKKIDILQLKHDYDQLKQEHQSFNEKVEHLRQELQQTQLERDHYRRENIQIVQDIERLKVATPTNVIVQSAQVTTSVPIKQNSNNQTGIIDQLKDLLPQQITPDQAKSFIEDIYRRRTEFDDEDMRKSICGSLKRLGSDLYSSSVHFLHELIQNAEDNTYVGESRPYLRIELNHDYILFSNNEQGLRPRDVLAICSLAVTTKTSEQKHIGEKGVGFKSVFAASNRPMLFSHSWKFRFQVPGTDAMSYITPLWINDQDIPQYIANQISANRQHTHLYLPLKLTPHTDLAKQFLDDVAKAVDPCILLNMRKLQKVEVVDQREEKVIIIEKNSSGSTKLVAQHVVEFEGLKFLDLVGLKAQLSTLSGKRTFRVYTCQIDVPSAIEERTNPMTMLTLAFPCEYDYDLTATVYNGLPVCDLGFKFMFNAEFHLVTSRENVRENVPLNTYLRDHLAVLFVYLLLNDTDLKKDISHYCPSSNIHQVKHSSWWRSMIGRINQLIENHLSILFDIGTGKEIRSMNPKISSLISKEQLYDYANIQVIDSNDEFFTTDRLKSLHIQTVSIKDVLKCFPNRHEPTNDFLRWTQKQDQQWWSHFFHHLSEEMTSEVSDLILQKPIFFLQDHHQRQYLPKMSENSSLLYINDDRLVRIWKRRLTILQYASTTERTALIRSGHVKSLTEQELIDIIQIDHLQLSIQSMRTPVDDDVLEEIWKDLSYLQSRIDKLDRAKPLLVPIQGSSRFTLIQNTTLPTFFGRDMRFFMDSTVVMFVHFPYYEVDPNSLVNNLQWEYFLLKMQCKPPSINLPQHYTTARLPCLPSFTMFTDENIARFGEFILSVQQDNTQQALRQFPIIAQMNSEEQLRPIETTFDQSIITDLPSLPRIDVPSYCRSLAMKMGVSTDYDLNTCVSILQYLGDEKITNVDLYIEWLGRLQLEVRQNNKNIDKKGFRSTCQLYLPDKQQFCSLKHLLVMSEINDQNREEDDSSRAIIAISALATLLHKRQQHLPFDEAKLTARQKIVDCNEFLSRVNARVACAKADLYPYVELLFPTDHESLKSIAISISGVTRIEQDAEENLITLERSGVDELFRIRAEKQDHRFQQPKRPDNWTNPSIVDGEEHIRIGQNAEHFFFDYLQRLYGTIDVQPTNNWRSSARLVTYPQYTRDVNDSAGYDLELHDTMELFTKGTKSRTKKCYFEVKGTSGSFHEEHTSFHISQNEQEKCKSIADDSRRREQEAYFLVIIEHCLDPEKIALAKILDWSSQFHSIELIVDGYQCRFLSTPPIHITHGSGPQRQSDRPWRSPRLQHEQTQDFRTGGRERGSTVDRSGINSDWRKK